MKNKTRYKPLLIAALCVLGIPRASMGGEVIYSNEALEGATREVRLGEGVQKKLEEKLVAFIQAGNFEGMVGLLPQLESFGEQWDFKVSEFFDSAQDFMGFVHALRAYDAWKNEKIADFEAEAKTAFWLNPSLSPLLSSWVTQYRMEKVMNTLRLPMDTVVARSQGGSTRLSDLVGDNKALLIDFWASWCGPCMQLMPELIEKSEKLAPQGVIVAGMNTENKKAAEGIRSKRKISFPWLVEPDNRVFSNLLQIDSIPRMVLITPEGKVLFNGHPRDPSLGEALARLDVHL